MSRRRRGSAFGFGSRSSVVRLVIVAVLGLAAWLGKSSWQGSGWPTAPKPPTTNPSATSAASSAGESSENLTLVERVVVGDTFVIEGGDRVRMIGVDTPETHHPTKPVQPFGPEAYEYTKRTIEGKRVELRFDPGETKDRYGRTLAYVYVDGQFLNETLIREGLARALLNYPFSREMKDRFRAAEDIAKASKRGVWSLPSQKTDVSRSSGSKRAG